MNDFLEKLKKDFKEISDKAQAAIAKLTGKQPANTAATGSSLVTTAVNTNYEINLVPQVKMQMIKAQKVRNLVLFICILVSSIAVGAVVILFGIKSGQDIALGSKDTRLELMSEKLNEYGELTSLLTIQNQLVAIDEIVDQKTVASRVFAALGVMLPAGVDVVQMSEVNINMSNYLVRMDGRADAKTDPPVDYRVLDSFKKGAALTKYDYGQYVDMDGNVIPAYCISETDAQGNSYKTGVNYYAWWDLTIDGCAGSQRGGAAVEGANLYYSLNAEIESGYEGQAPIYETVCDEKTGKCEQKLMEGAVDVNVSSGENGEGEGSEGETGENQLENAGEGEGTENEEGGENAEDSKNEIIPMRVKIWRTPQFSQWYSSGKMSLDGAISDVEHFDSQCFQYRGMSVSSKDVRWTSTNDCMLAPEGLEIKSSNNARDESDNLVLKFSATVTLAEDYFKYQNKHMIAIGPMGQNVTDSYIQIGNMFAEEAKECAADDVECLTNSTNSGGSSGSSEQSGGNS